jgi:hypothetical protein
MDMSLQAVRRVRVGNVKVGRWLPGLLAGGWLACSSAQAATRYVWPSSPTPGSGYTS